MSTGLSQIQYLISMILLTLGAMNFQKSQINTLLIKTRRVKSMSKSPWITPELTELMRERDYHQKQAHKTNSEYHWQHFRQLRNHVNNQVKLAKSKYFQDSVNSNKDKPSDLWKTLNELTSRNKSGTTPSCIISEEMPITDQKSIASILNEYFTSLGQN